MSAPVSPVGGLAWATLSILTASTGPRVATGSPVNGDSKWAGWFGFASEEQAASATAAAAAAAMTMARLLNIPTPCLFPGLRAITQRPDGSIQVVCVRA